MLCKSSCSSRRDVNAFLMIMLPDRFSVVPVVINKYIVIQPALVPLTHNPKVRRDFIWSDQVASNCGSGSFLDG